MHFVRGSHQWGLLPGSDFYGQDLADDPTTSGWNCPVVPSVAPIMLRGRGDS